MTYFRVLKIGSECLECGISFNQLKKRLEEEGYSFDGCLENCLREWFYMSFFHEEAHCKQGGHTNVSELNRHLDCNFVLKAESCMKLLTFIESENNAKAAADNLRSTQDNLDLARKSLKTSKKSVDFGKYALFISIVSIGFTVFNFFKPDSSQLLLQSQLKTLSEISVHQDAYLSKFDSLTRTILKVQDDTFRVSLVRHKKGSQ